MDTDPPTGDVYYRLKMEDKDDTFTYSEIESISVPQIELQTELFPNPASGFLYVKSGQLKYEELRVVDELGRDLNHLLHFSTTSDGLIKIDLRVLSNGVYYVTLPNKVFKVVKN